MVPTNYLIKNLIEHKISDNIAFRYEIVNYNLNEYIPCELSPGDAIILVPTHHTIVLPTSRNFTEEQSQYPTEHPRTGNNFHIYERNYFTCGR